MDTRTYKIALLTPTRGRPEWLTRFWDSCLNTVIDKNSIRLYVYIDNDDPNTKRGVDLLEKMYPNQVKSLIGPRIKMSDMVNKLFTIVEEDILYLAADDLYMRTKGWDQEVITVFNQIPDKIALLYGEDLAGSQHPANFATHPILHRNWVKALGYVSPPYFSCDYADTWINELADIIGRKVKLNFVNEHLHYSVGKAPMHQLYAENRGKFYKENTIAIYQAKAHERIMDSQKLVSFIKSYEK